MRKKHFGAIFLSVTLTLSTAFTTAGCEKDCDHEYNDWKVITAATCETEGEEKRICKSCGETESRTIPATGHTGNSIACLNCGKVYVTDEFLKAFIGTAEVAESTGINVEISPFTLSVTQENETGNESPVECSITEAFAYLGTNTSGEPLAYGKATGFLKSYESSESTTPAVTIKTETAFLLEQDVIYAAAEFYPETNGSFEETPSAISQYYCGSVAELLKSAFGADDRGEISDDAATAFRLSDDSADGAGEIVPAEESYAETIARILYDLVFRRSNELFDYLDKTLLPFLNEATAAYETDYVAAAARLLAIAYDIEQTADGYVLSAEENRFSNIVNDMQTMTISALLNKYAGKGAFEAIERLPALLNVTVGDVFANLERHGVTAARLTALIDAMLELLRVEKDGAQATLGSYDIDLEQIKTLFRDTQIRTLIESAIPQDSGITLDVVVATFNQALSILKNSTIPQLLQMSGLTDISAIFDELKQTAELYESAYTEKIYTDENGTIQKYALIVNKGYLEELFASTGQNAALSGNVTVEGTFGKADENNAAKFDAETFKKKFTTAA